MVKTPLQLINAIEAKHYFNLNANDCVLIIMGDRKSQPQILALAEATNEWFQLISLNDVNILFGDPIYISRFFLIKKIQQLKIFRKSFFYVRRLNKISNSLGRVNHIFVGYTRYIYMTHFINTTPHKDVIFLDDGNGTLELSQERKNNINLLSNIGLKKKLKWYGKKLIQRIKDKEPESACYFTAYDIKPGANDRVIKNNFKYLRSNVADLQVSAEVYFIGSPLSEVGIISQDEYFSGLRRVKVYFSEINLTYIAHRRDTPEKLDKIKNELGLKVVLFDYPIEYQLAFVGPRPKVLASFFSAALDSCRLIFGSQLKIYAFKLDMTNSPKREKVESIYNSYAPLVNDSFTVESNF